MILLDTNVLIEILKNNHKTIEQIQSFDEALAVSSITVMELYYGARDKIELVKLEKFVSLFHLMPLDVNISAQATKLIKTYAKSHMLDIPDALIASTSLVEHCKLFTYNIKDFKYIKNIDLV